MLNDISRRGMLGAVSLGLAPAVVGSQANAAPDYPPMSEYRKGLLMKGSLRQGLHATSLKGTFYAVEGGMTTPLHNAVMASFTKNRTLPDGSVQIKTIEIEWYTDLNGEIMDEWTNPVTGKTVPVAQMDKYFVNTIVMTPDGNRKSLTFGSLVTEKILGWREDGDEIWMFNQLSSLNLDPKGKAASTDHPKFVATELATYHARKSEFYTPGITYVRKESYHSCTGLFRPWQQMGDHPGSLLLLCNDRMYENIDELPPEWLKWTGQRFPELLKSPGTILDAA